jgi:hypothetical protein
VFAEIGKKRVFVGAVDWRVGVEAVGMKKRLFKF